MGELEILYLLIDDGIRHYLSAREPGAALRAGTQVAQFGSWRLQRPGLKTRATTETKSRLKPAP